MKAFFITLICISLFAIIGTGVYFYLSQNETTASSEPVEQSEETDTEAILNGETEAAEAEADDSEGGASEVEDLTQDTKDFLETFAYEDYEERIAYQDEAMVTEILKSQHEYLNDLTGWGHINSVQIENLKDSDRWQQLKEDVVTLREEGFASSEAVNDMWNAEAFIRIAEDAGDVNSLRYLHRIFHDMDAEINGTEVDKMWDVTRAFGAEMETSTLYNYIKG